MWYVVQVSTGSEESTRVLIEQVAEEGVLRECFVPRYRTAIQVDGKWVPCEKVLFPGYLIVVTNQIDRLEQSLRIIPKLTRILSSSSSFVPLNEEERLWIDAFTQRDHRVIEMSEGYLEGDQVVITSGPLLNRAGWIRKVNHRKKVAYLEIEMFGRTLNVEVGLRIVRKRS